MYGFCSSHYWIVVSFTQRQINILQRSSSSNNYIGLVLKTLGWQDSRQIPTSFILKNPINKPSYKAGLTHRERQLFKSSLSFELKYIFLFSLPFKKGKYHIMKIRSGCATVTEFPGRRALSQAACVAQPSGSGEG